MKKILVFAETEREARKHAERFMKPDVAVGYRAAASFNPEKPEACDEAHIFGNFPEIEQAYKGATEQEANLDQPKASRARRK